MSDDVKKRESAFTSADAKCPFYIRETTSRIICEGVTDASEIDNHFDGISSKRKFRKEFCYQREDCKKCLIYRALFDKYTRMGYTE